MNPNYMNQNPPGPPPSYGYGAAPPNMGGPPPRPGGMMMNGAQRPPAPGPFPGQAPGPTKGGPPSMMNGPAGDQFPPRNGPSGPASFPGPPPPNPNQVSNQMGAMNIGGPQKQFGPPSGPPPNGPPPTGAAPPRGPPGAFPPPSSAATFNGQAPPSSQFGSFPPPPPSSSSSAPTSQFGGPPTSQFGPPPTSQTGGPPPPSSTPTHNYGPMSSSAGYGGPPPGSSSGFPPPPNASGAATGFQPQSNSYPTPPASAGSFPPPPPVSGSGPPPTSNAGFAPPPTSNTGFAPPPTSGTCFAPPPPAGAGFPPPSSGAGFPPPPSSGAGFPPPPSSGAGFPPPPSSGSGYPPPPSSGAGFPPPPSSTSGSFPAPGSGYPAPGSGYPPPPTANASYPAPQIGSGYPAPPPPAAGASGMPPAAAAGAGGYNNFAPPPGPAAAPSAAQQQPRRLDPDQMPSPIQVIQDDNRSRGGLFETGQRGSVPPLVTSSYTCQDQGHASPRFLRSTMYNVPATADMLKQSHLPFVVNISPFAKLDPKEAEPPIVDLGQLGPIRCNRCKAYMCPYMLFIDGGRRFQCSFCSCATEVPPEYFAHLDHTGRRTDCYDRPELCLGTYEFVATTDYCKNNILPKPPAFIFMIDVSYNSIKSGLVHLMCAQLKEEVLVNLPKETGQDESEIRVGFVTYHKELHFYNVKGSLAQPQMLVVSDVQDVFVPLLDGFLVKLSESEAVIDSLMEQIPTMFQESRETEIVLGPVIQAGLDALKAAGCTGKLFVFHSSLPIGEAPGKLKNRDDRKLLGTDKEKTLLAPQIPFYTKLGQECVSAGCSVDIYLFPNAYTDISTIAEVPRLTGGSLYKYTYFQADLDGERFMKNLQNNVSRPIAFDAIMRVRTSTGIRPVDFLGNFYMSNTTDVELASMDCDKSVSVEIKHDDKLSEADGACLQCAVLYTSTSGQRRLRVVNTAFNVCAQLADMFRNCELDVMVNYMSKQAIRGTLNSNPKAVREHLMNQCAQILACYRKNCASPSSAGQLILPECMKLLPVYTNCIIKNGILCGSSDISTDERSFQMMRCNAMPIHESVPFFYPRLLPLHDVDVDSTSLPQPIRCSYERLKDSGVYLLENGFHMFLWIGLNVPAKWVHDAFGVQSAAQIDIDMTMLQDLDNPLSRRVRDIVKTVREERAAHLKLNIIRQRDKLEPVFQQYLVEDRGASGSASYVDFLCHIHKEIRNLLS